MSSTYSPSLRIELIGTGDQAGTWGNTTNTNLGTLLESAVCGYTSVAVISANQALTALNGAADESRNAVLALTTSTGANFAVYAPPAEKTYVIYNASGYTATIYNSTVLGNTTAAGTGVAIPAGKTLSVWSDGTNFAVQTTHLPSLTLTTDLAVADGGTGASTAANARTNLGLVIGTDVQAYDADLTALGALAKTDGNFIVGNGTTWVAESGATARTSLGLGTIATQNSNAVAITGGSVSGITDLAVADGGTGASTAANALANLGGAPLASPAFTGTPTAPTASYGTNTTQLATTAFVQAALQALYPVGSVYINATNSTNPRTLFGFGTWVAFGAGRVPVGFDSGNSLFNSAEETGGSYDSAVVAHTHSFSATTSTKELTGYIRLGGNVGFSSSVGGIVSFGSTTGTQPSFGAGTYNNDYEFDASHNHTVSGTTGSTGSSGTNANIQPYITVYMWKRTA